VLHGQGIRILIEGRIDSHHGGLRGSFEGLPDAPLSKFTMVLNGGKRGLLVNEKNLCAHPQVATARFVGQDNTGEVLEPRLQAPCLGTHGKKTHHGGQG
jgi:hypothetical protein